MKCPNCYSNVPANAAKCPRCDWQLRAAPKSSDGMWGNDSFSTNQTWNAPPVTPNADQWNAAPRERDTTWDTSAQWDSFDQNAAANADQWNAAPRERETTWDKQQPGAPTIDQWGDAVQFQPQQTVQAPSQEQWNDAARAMLQPGGGVPTTVPLTGGQKAQLMLVGLVPLAVISFFGFMFLSNLKLIGIPWLVVMIFAGAGIFVLFLAIQSLRDLLSGVANVQVLRLQKTNRVRQKNGYSYYAHFEGVGRMNTNRAFYDAARQGALYQVTYSPNMKKLWKAELR